MLILHVHHNFTLPSHLHTTSSLISHCDSHAVPGIVCKTTDVPHTGSCLRLGIVRCISCLAHQVQWPCETLWDGQSCLPQGPGPSPVRLAVRHLLQLRWGPCLATCRRNNSSTRGCLLMTAGLCERAEFRPSTHVQDCNMHCQQQKQTHHDLRVAHLHRRRAAAAHAHTTCSVLRQFRLLPPSYQVVNPRSIALTNKDLATFSPASCAAHG
jgi:hypothetical protein